MCNFCFDCTVDDSLTPQNDLSYRGVGTAMTGIRILFRSGGGRPAALMVEGYFNGKGWETVAEYRLKYCPECGRHLADQG